MNQVRFCVHPKLEEKDRQKVCNDCGKKFGSDFKLHATPFFRPGAIIEFRGSALPPTQAIGTTTWMQPGMYTSLMGYRVE